MKLATILSARGHVALSWLDRMAAGFLGEALPPANRAVAESGWEADNPGAYCQRCGDSTGRGEASSAGCGSCRGRPRGVDALVRLGPYAEPLRGWITAIKYEQRWEEMAGLLGEHLGRAVLASGRITASRAVVVPMPMPWQRRLYRGIDHARVIAQGVAGSIGAPVVDPLVRVNQTPQVALASRQRRRAGARAVRWCRGVERWWPADVDVVLVDDVRTTGASLKVAARLLRRLGPRTIVGAVIAVADDPARRRESSAAASIAPNVFNISPD